MADLCFCLFPTKIGHCTIAWSSRGVVALQLPEGGLVRSRSRIRKQFPRALECEPPTAVGRAIRAVVGLLEGKRVDLSRIVLDEQRIPPFHRRVYGMVRRIPAGSILSYGAVAKRVGSPRAARAVGQALGHNPWALIVPCHRVVAANGKLTGFSARGGIATKRRLLEIEQCQRTYSSGSPDDVPSFLAP
jgi:methylated-DNA-[protein]-cysteine S-methyltransferase